MKTVSPRRCGWLRAIFRTAVSPNTCLLLLAFAGPAKLAQAGIVTVGGSAVIAEPPPTILVAEWEHDTEARVWLESQTVLAQDFTPNATNTCATRHMGNTSDRAHG